MLVNILVLIDVGQRFVRTALIDIGEDLVKAALVDVGQHLVRPFFALEGDSPLIFTSC